MLTASILLVVTYAPVKLDIRQMELAVMVRIYILVSKYIQL